MKKYQTIIRFVPNIKEEQVEQTLEKAKEIIEMSRIDKWGYQKLAYPIRHKNRTWFNSAYTVCCNIVADLPAIKKLEELLNQEEIIKFLIIRTN